MSFEFFLWNPLPHLRVGKVLGDGLYFFLPRILFFSFLGHPRVFSLYSLHPGTLDFRSEPTDNYEEFIIIYFPLKDAPFPSEERDMKYLFFVLALFFSNLENLYGGQEVDVTSMVQEEVRKTEADVTKTWAQAQQKLNELQAQRSVFLANSKKLGEDEMKGFELMQKYGTLLVTRYRNEKNTFEPGMEISQKEQDNINKLFQTYLRSNPLRGHTSAGEAKRVLEIGAKNVEANAKIHLNPSENNNSDFEILNYQIGQAEISLAKVTELAKVLGIEPNEGRRTPASR